MFNNNIYNNDIKNDDDDNGGWLGLPTVSYGLWSDGEAVHVAVGM